MTDCIVNDAVFDGLAGHIDTEGLLLEWVEAPWDTAVFGYPVLQINHVEIRGPSAGTDFAGFEKIRAKLGVKIISCRLPHGYLRESMFLEDHGFRFIEMIYGPEYKQLQEFTVEQGEELAVMLADSNDLPEILAITESAFHNERFHVDPRLDHSLGSRRYCNWVRSSLEHDSQKLYVLRDKEIAIAFFVTERLDDGTCYWHLNAVAPDVQGHGYGRRAWLTMMNLARKEGARQVKTSIVARNHKVLNLYSSLGFRFPPPMMTFHWVR